MLKQIAAIPGPQAIKLSLLLLLALLFAGAVAGATLSLTLAQAANGVYDTDGDKLIEISNLDQLNALRYDRDGDGAADQSSDAGEYSLVFPVHSNETVCDSGCNGYELAKSLDFNQVRQLPHRRGQHRLDVHRRRRRLDAHRPPGQHRNAQALQRQVRGQRLHHFQPVQQCHRHRPRNRPFRPPGR